MATRTISKVGMSAYDDSGRKDAGDFGGGTLARPSIAEQVANRIMAMIKSGNLKPGDRLPTEQQMTIAFGISRPPLREALKALTLMGVLVSRQGGRYTVTDLSPSRLVAPFNTMLSVADYDVDMQFEARTVVDLELVRLCAERASPELRQRIRKLGCSTWNFTRRSMTERAIAFSRPWPRCSTTWASTSAAPPAKCLASLPRASASTSSSPMPSWPATHPLPSPPTAPISSMCATPPSRPNKASEPDRCRRSLHFA